MRIPFIVGRLTARESQVVVVQRRQPRRLPGPWVVSALVQGSGSGT
jgi:hypothetical protein